MRLPVCRNTSPQNLAKAPHTPRALALKARNRHLETSLLFFGQTELQNKRQTSIFICMVVLKTINQYGNNIITKQSTE
jgi:hypothetical protein